MKFAPLVLLFIFLNSCLFSQQRSPNQNPLTPAPTDRKGLNTAFDSTSSMNSIQLREESFGKDLLKHASVVKKDRAYSSGNKKTEVITFMVLKQPVKLNCLVLKEALHFGQAIETMDIVLSDQGTEVRKLSITTIGSKRILTFPVTEVSELSFIITAAKMKPHLEAIAGYLVNEKLTDR